MVRNALFLKKVSSERVKVSLLAIEKKGEREKAGPQENRKKSVLVQYSSTAVVEYSKKKQTNNR